MIRYFLAGKYTKYFLIYPPSKLKIVKDKKISPLFDFDIDHSSLSRAFNLVQLGSTLFNIVGARNLNQ